MNRFRKLKEKLINSKRDSQKLQQLQKDQKALQTWVQQQLEYYGIKKQSYRLRQLKDIFSIKQQSNQANHQSQNSTQKWGRSDVDKTFSKKATCYQQQNRKINNLSPAEQREESPLNEYNSEMSACNKFRNQHVSSMSDIDKIMCKQDKLETSTLKSYQPQNQLKQPEEGDKIQKQLDYYTLILQLTAELNYSRLNKQASNEKSILKQIKNLIEFIQGKSSETGIPISKSQNKMSNHTFSSVYSNQSLMNDTQMINQINSQERRIKYKLVQQKSSSSRRIPHQQSNVEQNRQNEEQNKTFESINRFQQSNNQQEEQANTSIIDLVNNSQHQKDILIQEDQSQQESSLVYDSPLSRITEHQSQYTDSVNPSVNASPGRRDFTPNRFTMPLFQTQNGMVASRSMEKKLQEFYAQNKLKKTFPLQSGETYSNFLKFFPQNELILKKLSDKLQIAQQPHNVFEQSLQYKRILYMLDSQYVNSDYKSRTLSSLPSGQVSSLIQQNNIAQNKSLGNHQVHESSDSSAKSFFKQIFQSNQQLSNQKVHQATGKTCLMKNLDQIFKAQYRKQKTPCQEQLSTQKHSKEPTDPNLNSSLIFHKRSKTTSDNIPNLNKTTKYRFNLLSELSQQIEEEQQSFNHNNYGISKTEYQEDSVYHKVSRNSYLTSCSIQQKSQSDFPQTIKNTTRRGNFVVKKNVNKNYDLQIVPSDRLEKQVKFVVKKNNIQSHRLNCNQQVQEDRKITQQDISKYKKIMKRQSPPSMQKKSDTQSSFFRSDFKQINLSEIQVIQKQNVIYQSLNHVISSSQSQGSKQQKNTVKSPSLAESKASMNSNRQIKYKVYQSASSLSQSRNLAVRPPQKQDKRRVLKDIVSMLNTKYNKNISLKNS